MPADEEELEMAVEDGVEFMELLAPVKAENGRLLCKVMKLGDHDASGRRGVVETEEEKEIPADTVIAAVGEKVPTGFYEANGIHVNDRGRALVNEETCETNLAGVVYVVGDGLGGPATVVEGIRDGRRAAEAVIGESLAEDIVSQTDEETVYNRRGNLADAREDREESGRCLGCEGICENCVEVCPNRANIAIRVPGMEKHQIIHVDYMCNECGNCKSFCPYDSAPYLDKFTLFADEKDMEDSKNQGFAVLDREAVKCKVRFFGDTYMWTKGEETRIPDGLQKLMEAVCPSFPGRSRAGNLQKEGVSDETVIQGRYSCQRRWDEKGGSSCKRGKDPRSGRGPGIPGRGGRGCEREAPFPRLYRRPYAYGAGSEQYSDRR